MWAYGCVYVLIYVYAFAEAQYACSDKKPGPVADLEWSTTNAKTLFSNQPANIVYHKEKDGKIFIICRAKTSDKKELIPGKANSDLGGCEIVNKQKQKVEIATDFEVLLTSHDVYWRDTMLENRPPKYAAVGGCDVKESNLYICRCNWGNEIGTVYQPEPQQCHYAMSSQAKSCQNYQLLMVIEPPKGG